MSSRPSLAVILTVLLLGGGLIASVVDAFDGPEATAETGEVAGEESGAASANERPVSTLEGAGGGPHSRVGRDDGIEDEYAPPPAPGEAAGAGEPAGVVARFTELWVNRAGTAAELRRQRVEMVGLSHGIWARELDDQLRAAIESPAEETSIEGQLILVEELSCSEEGAVVLAVARERLTLAGEALEPYRYATYVGRLTGLPGGYAINSWEPQR